MTLDSLKDTRRAYEVACPYCGAEPKQPCHYKSDPAQTVGVPHSGRQEAWAVAHWNDPE